MQNIPPDYIERTTSFAEEHTRTHDASHGILHVKRVLTLARHIARQQQQLQPNLCYDDVTITLMALLHDVADRKYVDMSTSMLGEKFVPAFLRSCLKVSDRIADRLVLLMSAVSYSHECENADRVRELIQEHPELAVVQDADRLDALGAIGVARCFVYGATTEAKMNQHAPNEDELTQNSIILSMEHFHHKLEKLEALMKTEIGRRLARVRSQKLQMFKQWYVDETDGSFEHEMNTFATCV